MNEVNLNPECVLLPTISQKNLKYYNITKHFWAVVATLSEVSLPRCCSLSTKDLKGSLSLDQQRNTIFPKH